MPSFVSKGGVWEPAIEKTVVNKVNPDGSTTPDVYEGPDREALKYIKENGGTVGMEVSVDPQVLELADRQHITVEEYLKRNAPRPEQVKAKELADSTPVTHSSPAPKPGVDAGTGGGFNQDDVSPSEAYVEKKRGRPAKGV